MLDGILNCRAVNEPFNYGGWGIELYFCIPPETRISKRKIGKPLEMEDMKKEQQGLRAIPSCRLEREAAQLLMDDLWQAGLRPSEGTGSAGAYKAVEKHLSDMKRIAFHVLKIEV